MICALYCYLKPALGFWGFIVCRSQPSDQIQAFNRTLFKNVSQQRGVLILCDDICVEWWMSRTGVAILLNIFRTGSQSSFGLSEDSTPEALT
jgi:hypothetical protein